MKKLLSRLGGFLLLLSLAAPALSEEVRIPAPLGHVSDYAGVIDPATEAALASLIKDVERKTTAEIAILTVETTQPLDVFQYSIKVFDRWKIGKKGKDTGVLFLVAVKDRRMWITVGYGLEGILPDGKVGEIRDRFVIPYFRQGNYGKGILEGTRAIAAVIAGERPPVSPADRPHPELFSWGQLLFAVFALLFLVAFVFPILAGTWHHRRIYRGWDDIFWVGPFGSSGAWRGGGGWGGGGFSGGNFGGFGGGATGGGGAGGSW